MILKFYEDDQKSEDIAKSSEEALPGRSFFLLHLQFPQLSQPPNNEAENFLNVLVVLCTGLEQLHVIMFFGSLLRIFLGDLSIL